ncbi:hypothetical protein Tco_0797774 [Tanacetum coccineum]
MVRAKELFTWNPSFIDNKKKDYVSEEESDFVPNNNESNHHINEEVFGDVYGSDDDGVPETVFGSNTSSPNQVNGGKENSKSEDPFGIYDMLANKKDNVTSESRPFLSHPPGFTPEGVVHHEKMGTANREADNNGGKDNSVTFSARVMNNSQDIPEEMHSDSVGSKTVHKWRELWSREEIGLLISVRDEKRSGDYSNIDGMTRFTRRNTRLNVFIRRWVKTKRLEMVGSKLDIIAELEKIDKAMDIGVEDRHSTKFSSVLKLKE